MLSCWQRTPRCRLLWHAYCRRRRQQSPAVRLPVGVPAPLQGLPAAGLEGCCPAEQGPVSRCLTAQMTQLVTRAYGEHVARTERLLNVWTAL